MTRRAGIGSAWLVAAFALALAGCGDGDEAAETPGPLTYAETVELNNRGVALMDRNEITAAEPLFREMTERAPQCYAGWINLAIALLNRQHIDPAIRRANFDECERILRRLVAEHEGRPAPLYTLAVLVEFRSGDFSEVVGLFERAHALAPTDPDCLYRLGKAYLESRPPRLDEAVEMLREAIRYEPHFQGAWHALRGAFQRARRNDDAKQARAMFDLFQSAKPELGKKLSLVYGAMGRYAEVERSVAPFGKGVAGPAAVDLVLAGKDEEPAAPAAAGWPHRRPVVKKGTPLREAIEGIVSTMGPTLAAHDVDGDGRLDLYVTDAAGPGRLLRGVQGGFADETAKRGLGSAAPSLGAVFGDVDHDGHPDLYIYGAGPNRLFLNDGTGSFRPTDHARGADAVTVSAQIVDADHDGDLDILCAGFVMLPAPDARAGRDLVFPDDFAGAPNHLFNNGRPTIYDAGRPTTSEAFADIGPRTGLAGAAARTAAVVAFDADRDGDVDVFFANDGAANRLALNDRLWRYHDAPAEWKLDDVGPAGGAVCADLDQDGDLDLLLMRGGEMATVALWNEDHAFRPDTSWSSKLDAAAHRALPFPGDFDDDGDPDLALVDSAGLVHVSRNDGGGAFSAAATAHPLRTGGARSLLASDTDGDGRLDLLLPTPDALPRTFRNETRTPHRQMTIALAGKEVLGLADMWSNTFGVGASLEIAAGARKVYLDLMTANGSAPAGPEVHVGLGGAGPADYVRIIWPDLVLQSELDLAAGRRHVIPEANRKASSCPVLFKASEEGNGFDFVTDFLGVGGLGFFIEPGLYAPPDKTETVRIGTLPERDGVLALRIAEPMEEICYVDELELLVVEHAPDVHVFADERLATADPAPTGRPIAWRHQHLPRRAVTRRGTDCTAEVTTVDRIYQPDVRRDRRFIGYLAEEQHLALDFDARDVMARRPHARSRLFLFVDGWVEYPYSHVNFAAWQAGVRAESFSVDAWDEKAGRWTCVLPELGYPAGMTRCMAADVTPLVSHGLARLRLRSNLEIFVDRVYLAWALDDDAFASRTCSFDRAELRWLGYTAEKSPDGKEPKLYDYQDILETFDWKVMGGSYTPFGDVRALIAEADDRLVVMNHGEELALEVDASRLGPLPEGRTRTFFLRADGWCKDMDPYTAYPDTVAPLPHQQMKTYPPAEAAPARNDANSRHVPGTWR